MLIDLRSDTVTKPGPAMRAAMATAEVGDDVFGEDPTVNGLEENVSSLLGKEAGLFVASGTMGNQTAIKAHTQPGDEVLCDRESHIFNYECGTAAAFSGVQLCPLDGKHGFFSAAEAEAAVRPDNPHHPRTRLITVENTHNRAGGTVCPAERIAALREVADRHDLSMHLDGARLWNASIATGLPPAEIAAPFDSVSVCFSKGLGAPVGSMLAGSREFIARARRVRKMLGGGMRQAGVLAAAAQFAVDQNRSRLAEDHVNARRFAEAVARLPGALVPLDTVQSNIVLIHVTDPERDARSLAAALRERNVLVLPFTEKRIRAVFHLDVSSAQTNDAIAACKDVFGG
jgi:threonine aldolase